MQFIRNLVVVFGDQLNADASAFDGFDAERDAVWMAEADEEATHVWSTKARIAMFLAGMRHFRDAERARGRRVIYAELGECDKTATLAERLRLDLRAFQPNKVIATRPGEWRVLEALKTTCAEAGVDSEVREDRRFFSDPEAFAEWAKGRKAFRMEHFYRAMRKRHGILMDGDEPAGGAWNFDRENRASFGKAGPGDPDDGPGFPPDTLTREVIDLVNDRFSGHPGRLDSFAWPVTPDNAQEAMERFVRERLPKFGAYQDAMWTDEPWLYHSHLSAALNLKLLDPRDVVAAAEQAYRDGNAPLAAVEGLIRQILGWREYVRGIYWLYMPEYAERNALGASEPLPSLFWTGDTPLECLRQSVGQTLEHGYAHHIQRLMVTGLYALLLGVEPRQVHEWYLAVYVDAVEWVELPNTLGMALYGDGGLMASKPYAATGKYIQRMSNYCAHCPKNPKKRVGEDACPFTTLYWDFLMRHETTLRQNRRMRLQARNVERLSDSEKAAIRRQAEAVRRDPAMAGAGFQHDRAAVRRADDEPASRDR